MLIAPEKYGEYSAYDLLLSVVQGHLAFDHRLLHRLLDHPEETLPDIVRFANEEPRPTDRIDCSEDLMRIFNVHPAPEAVPFLMRQIREFPEDIPDDLTEALVRIGRPALEPLLELFDEGVAFHDTAFLLCLLGVQDPRIDAAIEEIAKDDADEGITLRNVYAAHCESTDTEPYDIYAIYDTINYPDLWALPAVERELFLTHDSADLRTMALEFFITEELSKAQVKRVWNIAKTDPDARVRGTAWEVLRDYSDDEQIVESMVARIDNPETPPAERAGLCIGLAYNLDDPIVQPHLDATYNDPETRWKAVEAMARSFDQRFAEIMVKHVEDPVVEVRRSAIWGIGYLRIRSEAPKLEKLFELPEWRSQALYSYALAAPAEDTRLGLRQVEKRMVEIGGPLEDDEIESVYSAFDLRLEMAGKKISYRASASESSSTLPARADKVGRNDPCPCGSGKKYKKCCGA